MTIRTVVQSSFSGGQVDESVAGRSDVEGYKTAALKMQNFMPTKTGSMKRRPGTIFCCKPFDSYVVGSEDTVDGLSFRDCNSAGDGTLISLNDSVDRQSLLAVSPSIVNLIEFGRPRIFDVGSFSFCPRIKTPTALNPNAKVDWEEVGCRASDTNVGTQDFETRSGTIDNRYDRPDTAFLKHLQVEDIHYLAPGGLTPMHACFRSTLLGDRSYTPTSASEDATVVGTSQSLVNMPVGFLDGPYIDRITDSSGDKSPGKLLTGLWPQFVQDAIDRKSRLFPCADYNGNLPLGVTAGGGEDLLLGDATGSTTTRTHRCGEVVLHLLTKDEANGLRKKFGRRQLIIADTQYNHAIDQCEDEPVGLADVLNQKMTVEQPVALEYQTSSEGQLKSQRFAFHFMGAFSCALKNPLAAENDSNFETFYPGAGDTTERVDYPNQSTVDTIKGETREFTVLVLRIAQTTNQDILKYDIDLFTDSLSEPSYPAFKAWPYGLDGEVMGDPSAPSGGSDADRLATYQSVWQDNGRGNGSGVLRIGPDTISGVAALAQNQGRMHLNFKSTPGIVFSTKINGFSIQFRKAGLGFRTIDTVNAYSNTALNDRIFMDFGDSSLTDTLSIAPSDSIQLLTTGDTGAKIRHLTPYKSQILVNTASSTMAISPARGEVLTPTNAKLITLSSNGISRTTAPVVVDNSLYFIDATDSRLTEIKLSNEAGTDVESREVSVASSSVIQSSNPVEGFSPALEVQRRIRSMTLHQYPIQHLRLVRSDGCVGVFICESSPDTKSFSTYKSADYNEITAFAFVNDSNGAGTYGIAKVNSTSPSEGDLETEILFREAKEENDGYTEGKLKLDYMSRLSTDPVVFERPAEDTIFTEDGEVDGGPFIPQPPQLSFDHVNIFAFKNYWFTIFGLNNAGLPDTQPELANPAQSPYTALLDDGDIVVQQKDGVPLPLNSVPPGRSVIFTQTANTTFDNLSVESGDAGNDNPLNIFNTEIKIADPRRQIYMSSVSSPGSPLREALGTEGIGEGKATFLDKFSMGSPTFDVIESETEDNSFFGWNCHAIVGAKMEIVVPAVAISTMTGAQTTNAKVPHLAGQAATMVYQGRVYEAIVDENGDVNFEQMGFDNFPEGAIIGKRYESEFESLPLQTISGNKGQGNDPKSDIKRVYRVGLHLNKSYGGLCGVSKLDEILYEQGSKVASNPTVKTGFIEHQVQDDGGKRLRTVKILSSDVYQLEVQAMHAEIDKGGI